MTTEEAIVDLDDMATGQTRRSWEIVKAELARVTLERDRLIEAWPTAEEFGENRAVEADHSGDFANWTKQYGDDARKARANAVRTAAGLDAREGE